MNTASIPALFEAVQLAIYNINESEEIQKQMAMYGFTAKRLQQGQSLLDQARLLDSTKNQHI